MGVLAERMFAAPEPLERLAPDASRLGALAPIAMRCLAKSPGERYASMAEVAAAIEAAMADPVIAPLSSLRPLAGPGQAPISLSPPGLRPILGPGAIAGLGVVVLGLIGAVGWLAVRGPSSAAAEAGTAPRAPESAATLAVPPPVSVAPPSARRRPRRRPRWSRSRIRRRSRSALPPR